MPAVEDSTQIAGTTTLKDRAGWDSLPKGWMLGARDGLSQMTTRNANKWSTCQTANSSNPRHSGNVTAGTSTGNTTASAVEMLPLLDTESLHNTCPLTQVCPPYVLTLSEVP